MILYHLTFVMEEFDDKYEHYVGAFSSKEKRDEARTKFLEKVETTPEFSSIKRWRDHVISVIKCFEIQNKDPYFTKSDVNGYDWESELDEIS